MCAGIVITEVPDGRICVGCMGEIVSAKRTVVVV